MKIKITPESGLFFYGDFIFTVRDISKPLISGKKFSIEEVNYRKSLPAMATGGASLTKKVNTNERKVMFLCDF